MAKKGSFSKVYDKNGDYADVEAVRFDGTRTVNIQGDVTATQTWNGDSNTALTLNASIGEKKVTTDKINDKAVQTGQIDDGAVGLPQIATSAMTNSATSGDTRLITAGGVRTEIDNAILNRGKDYGPMTPTQINAISETIPTGSTVHVTAAGTITDGDIEVRQGEDLKYYRSGNTHYWYSMDGDFKLKQQAKTSPTASGNALSFIDSITQDENGEITATKKSVQDGTTSQKGVVQLEDSHSSTSTTTAATPNSVKSAYDLANTANTDAVKNVAYDSTNKKITKTINGQTTDVVSAATLKTDMALNNVDNTSDANKPVSTAQQAALDLKLDKTGDGKDVTVSFSEASTRTNIGTGEKLSVMFGKIKKWFTDLKALAFKDTVSDSDISGTISDNHIASASTWNRKQNALPTSGTASSTYAINISGKSSSSDDVVVESIGSTPIDLDTLVAPDGHVHFYYWSFGNQGNVSNKPNEGSYTLKVLPIGAGSFVMQIAYPRNSTGFSIRCRTENSEPWSPWENVRDASWINSGVFNADRIPTSLPNVTAGSATTATNYASGGGIANALAGKQDSLAFMNDSEAVAIWNDAKTAAANAS